MSLSDKSPNSGIGTITIISAMDANRLIGKNGQMPWHISGELKNFKKLTMGRPMIMGRTTFESLGSKSLPGRDSIVVSRTLNAPLATNCHLAKDIEQALSIARAINQDEVMIIGGATIYEQFLPLANRMLLTKVNNTYSGDTYFPEYDANIWEVMSEDKHDEFCVFELVRKGN